jgi:hypothetical protein
MKLEFGEPRQPEPVRAAWIAAALLGAAALAAGWLRLGLPRPVCVFHRWTGLPCATCGTTRMIESLLAGDVAGALAWNPLVFVAMVVAVPCTAWLLVRTAVGLRPLRVVLGPRERPALAILVVAIVIAGWAFLIWRGA